MTHHGYRREGCESTTGCKPPRLKASMNRIRPRSLRTRLLVQILPAVALAIVAITAIAIKIASDAQRETVYREMSQQIAREASGFDGDVRSAQATARSIGAAVEADHTRDRARGA